MRYIVVETSPRRAIVAEPVNPYDPDTAYRACTKPMLYEHAKLVCYELNDLNIQDWSELTRSSYIEN
jgi:hypothetical protein